MPTLSRADFALLDKLHTRLGVALKNKFEYDRQWEELKAAIKERRDRSSRNRDVVSRARESGASIELADLLDASKWWREEANACATAILAKKAFLEMTQGGTAWRWVGAADERQVPRRGE